MFKPHVLTVSVSPGCCPFTLFAFKSLLVVLRISVCFQVDHVVTLVGTGFTAKQFLLRMLSFHVCHYICFRCFSTKSAILTTKVIIIGVVNSSHFRFWICFLDFLYFFIWRWCLIRGQQYHFGLGALVLVSDVPRHGTLSEGLVLA